LNGFDTYMMVYRKHFHALVESHPDYAHLKDNSRVTPDQVCERMGLALRAHTMNKTGLAHTRTCKELGIPHTYKAIFAFIEMPEVK